MSTPRPCSEASPEAPPLRCLTALPLYNEAKHLSPVLDAVVRHACDVLVVDDGSTDGSSEILANRADVMVVRHDTNRGYGAALKTAFNYAMALGYDVLVTIDCDGQHEPQLISQLALAVFVDEDADLRARGHVDIVSGSRYLECDQAAAGAAPVDRRQINQAITRELNERLGLNLTDAFCGFKAYRVASLAQLNLTESGYAMPLELWVQAARQGLRVQEVAVPLIYLDEDRSFGGALDEAEKRLAYYREVIDRACQSAPMTPAAAAAALASAASADVC